jgi:hypothetical protein
MRKAQRSEPEPEYSSQHAERRRILFPLLPPFLLDDRECIFAKDVFVEEGQLISAIELEILLSLVELAG